MPYLVQGSAASAPHPQAGLNKVLRAERGRLEMQVHTIRHAAGGAPPVAGRIIAGVLKNDLKRDFQAALVHMTAPGTLRRMKGSAQDFVKVYSTADKQKELTNCHLPVNCRVARSFFTFLVIENTLDVWSWLVEVSPSLCE